MDRIKVYQFHNGKGGGVLSVIRNLLQFSNNPLIENHIIFTINKDLTPFLLLNTLRELLVNRCFIIRPNGIFTLPANS